MRIIIIVLLMFCFISHAIAEKEPLYKVVCEVGWVYYNQFQDLLEELKFCGWVDYSKRGKNFTTLSKIFYVTIYDEKAREAINEFEKQCE